jgi:tRNA threonylcarbamoyl adenosine modification protein (Sua5/YciO/YrdC/YwlC family)
MAEIFKIYPDSPSEKAIRRIVDVLQDGGIIVYPTDTVYSFGCDLLRQKSIDQVARIKGIKPKEADFSIIFNDLGHLANYTRPIESSVFKTLKRSLPGPYTFILEASRAVPKIFGSNKRTIGIRIPDHPIPRLLVEVLGRPIIASSVNDQDEVIEYTTDPELINEKYGKQVDLIVDCGYGDNHASTVVDMTSGEAVVLREGKGSLDNLS